MKHIGKWTGKFWMACSLVAGSAVAGRAHVTLRPNQPLTPGGYANVSMIVPNERHVNNVSVTLEIPEAFLNGGGRLNRVEYPAGWEVQIEKENKPGEVYQKEMDDRKNRRESAGQASTASADKPQETDDPQEEEIMNELRKQWIKRVTFSGGAITPDGFRVFLLSFQLPEQPGSFRFPAVQSYEDGKEVSPKSRLVTILLAVFIGSLGIYRFYVGKVGTGIAMIFTLGGLGIWTLIDIILIATGSFTDIDGKYVLDWQV